MHVLCSPSTDLLDTLPIDDSSGGQEISIVNNCAVGTYDFTTDPRHPDSVHIKEGNYIAFKDKYSKTRLYTIMTIEGDEEWDVHCEDIGLDLINEDAEAWDYTGNPKTIAETLAVVLNDTGWEIGINEVASYQRATKFEGITDSWLTRLGDVCGNFDCECEFAIEMKGAAVTKQEINLYKTLGEDRTQQRFIDNVNLISLRRSGSIEDLCTCVRCYGRENAETGARVTISDIVYDDGRYYSPEGHIRIYDREAHRKWSRFRAYNYDGQGEFDGYINGTFEYDTDSAQELFNRGLSELQSRNDVKVSYEAELYDLRADIGDTVQIADNSKTEKVYLSARVQSVTNHYTVSGKDTGVLANYKILVSNPTTDISDLVDQLKGQLVSIQSTSVSYQVGVSGTEPPTGEWLPDPPQTDAGQYLWTKMVTGYTDGSTQTAYSVSRNGADGEKGDPGAKGDPGEKGDPGSPGKDAAIQSADPPQDIDQMWYDTTDNLLKYYDAESGEWLVTNDFAGDINDMRQQVTSDYTSALNMLSDSLNALINSLQAETTDNSSSIDQLVSQIAQSTDDLSEIINNINVINDNLSGTATKEEIGQWARYVNGVLELGAVDSPFSVKLSTTELGFYQGGERIAYLSNQQLNISQAVVMQQINLGIFQIVYDADLGLIIR